MVIAIVLILLALGSVLFYFLSPWQLTPLASNWGAIDDTILISFWVTGFVFVAVTGFMAYAIIRYRYKAGRRASYDPENKKLEFWLTVVTTIGIAALLAPGLLAWGRFVSVPDDAHQVAVLGSQWHWQFRYPGEDGQLGRVHPRFISPDNPLGIDPDDPHGQDDLIVDRPIMYLPVGRPVEMVLSSRDVIHNFMVPNFRAKMDALPGQMSHFWFIPTEIGQYQSTCAQLCGVGHFAMRAEVHVVAEDEFEEWLGQWPTFAEFQASRSGDAEAGRTSYATCQACHGQNGEGNADLNAPALAGLSDWYLVRQLENFKSGARGTDPEDQFGAQMTPFADMLDAQAMRDVSAYIETLPASPAEPTISGNARRGARLYRTCANCHGSQGEGRWTTHAPRLAGMNDWYLVRQLEYFRDGVRGRHPEDPYGSQMIDMSQYLVDEQAVRDVVAHINTFPTSPSDDATAAVTSPEE
ncbi:MAG: cytochrome c oxidase subunit II [Wenzhouxiangellaceae bacterium]